MKRASGVLMHVSTLFGEYSGGAFGKECEEWIDFLEGCGFKYWQVLPFCLPDDCNSPYKSYSAFSVNPYMIDLKSLYEEKLITQEELNFAKQKTPYSCEFDRLKDERFELLKKASKRFDKTDNIDKFFESHEKSLDFCRFMSLKESNSLKMWTEWENDCYSEETYNAWKFIVYKFFEQWIKVREYAKKHGVKIIGDIPIYVSFDSSDVWASPKEFLLGKDNKPSCVAGVPPDYFCEDGQLWGNPLYNWDEMEKDGFSWWKERMKFMSELFDGVRIDHFRGIESYYSIPADEKTAKNGKWVKGPGMKFVKAVKEASGDMLIIAEDLGIITEEVEELVKSSGFPGMRVLQFAFPADSKSPHLPHNYIRNCVAYTGTHDNNTLLGYVWELDEKSRKDLLDYIGYNDSDWNRCYDEILRTMFMSHAGLLILPIQDILLYGSDTRFNTPGKCSGNWSFRITKDQLKSVDCGKFVKWNKIYSRD